MGMYTECLLNCIVKKGAKLDAIRARLAGEEGTLTGSPRDRMLLTGGSFYHHPEKVASLYEVSYTDSAYLFCRFDLKNYDSDIEIFLDWLSDAVDEVDDTCIGWYWYEEDPRPSLLIMKNGRITISQPE